MKKRLLRLLPGALAGLVACGKDASPAYVSPVVAPIVYHNPVVLNKFTADPAAMVSNGTVYLYTGHDEAPAPQNQYVMNEWLCFSSTDMVNWTEHPVPLKVTDFAWARADAWASQVIERNGKFYWYVAIDHRTVPGKSIGVAVADNPIGPFKDARGTALVTNDMTKAVNSYFDDIDPTVLIDDDGQAYMYWGNSACYFVKLKANMIELDGPITTIPLPQYTEAPWIHKRGAWYYLSYASSFPEQISYAMSRHATGPWVYKGVLNDLVVNCETNHQALIDFKGQWYFVYHNGAISPNGGSFRRSVNIDYLKYNADSTLQKVVMTPKGVDLVP